MPAMLFWATWYRSTEKKEEWVSIPLFQFLENDSEKNKAPHLAMRGFGTP